MIPFFENSFKKVKAINKQEALLVKSELQSYDFKRLENI